MSVDDMLSLPAINSMASVTYNGEKQTPTVTVPGLTLGVDYTLSWNDDSFKDAKTYNVTATGTGAYGGSVTQTYTIKKANLTITANNKLIKPGAVAANNGVTYSGFVGGESESVLGGVLVYDYNYTTSSPEGKYTITPSGLTSNNYGITYIAGELTVSDLLELPAINPITSVTYNGAKQTPTVTIPGLTLGVDYTLSWDDGSFKNAKTYTVTATGKGVYGGSVTQTYTINKANLTITAKNKTIKPGETAANNGVTYSGFVGGDTYSVLTGNLLYSYNYTPSSPEGKYTITPSGLNADNYNIIFVGGELLVTAGGGEGNLDCIVHIILFVIAMLYLVFALLWFFMFQRKRFEFIPFIVMAATLLLSLIIVCFSRCIIDLFAIIAVIIALAFGTCLFSFGKKIEDDAAKKNSSKHPEKTKIAADKKLAAQARIGSKFIANIKKEKEKLTANGEAATENFGATSQKTLSTDKKSLKELFSIAILGSGNDLGINKKAIADYLAAKYNGEVIVNLRSNFICTGSPIADMHYTQSGIVTICGKALPTKVTKLLQGACFIYVYELADGKVLLLVKLAPEYAKEVKNAGHNIYQSQSPKCGEWYGIAVDGTFTSQQEIFAIIEHAKEVMETPTTRS